MPFDTCCRLKNLDKMFKGVVDVKVSSKEITKEATEYAKKMLHTAGGDG